MSAIERASREQFPEPDRSLAYLPSAEAGPALEALSSGTAQSIFAALCREQATATELADRTDTTVQNVGYHLTHLEDAGLVTVAGTRYSRKGREMKVYARAVAGLVIGERPEDDDSTGGQPSSPAGSPG